MVSLVYSHHSVRSDGGKSEYERRACWWPRQNPWRKPWTAYQHSAGLCSSLTECTSGRRHGPAEPAGPPPYALDAIEAARPRRAPPASDNLRPSINHRATHCSRDRTTQDDEPQDDACLTRRSRPARLQAPPLRQSSQLPMRREQRLRASLMTRRPFPPPIHPQLWPISAM